MTRTILVVVLILTGAAGSLAAQEPSLWTYQATDEITSIKVTRTGDLLVSSKSDITLINLETGKALWSRSGRMTYFEETLTGDLLVSSKSEIALVNTETGKALWSRDDIRDCEFHPREVVTTKIVTTRTTVLPDRTYCKYLKSKAKLTFLFSTPYALFEFNKGVAVINWLTGETLFDSTDHPLGKVVKLWYIEQLDQFMMLAEIKKKSYSLAAIRAGDNELQWVKETPIRRTATGWKYNWFGEREDGTGLFYWEDHDKNKFLTALNLDTGDFVWQARNFLQDKIRTYNIIYDTEETLLLFLNKDGPMRLGPDGQVLWRAEYLAGQNPSTMVYANGVLCVSQKDRVFAIDTSDGTVIWEEKVRFKPTTMVIHSRGLLIASKDKLNLLDLKTGKLAWADKVKASRWISHWLPAASLFEGRLPIVLDDDALYVASQKELRVLNLEEGTWKTIARYKFEDKEAPTSLSVINGNFFLNSSHNLAGFDPSGVKLYQRFYKAPGASKWAKLGAYLERQLSYISHAYTATEGQRKCVRARNSGKQGNKKCQQYVKQMKKRGKAKGGKLTRRDHAEVWKSMAPGGKRGWEQRWDQKQRAIIESTQAKIDRRYGTTVDTDRFIYIYFEEEKKKRDKEHQFGLVMFDKYAGKEVGRVWIGERDPEFTLDPVTRTVFFKSDKNIIQALRFPAGPEQQTAGN